MKTTTKEITMNAGSRTIKLSGKTIRFGYDFGRTTTVAEALNAWAACGDKDLELLAGMISRYL